MTHETALALSRTLCTLGVSHTIQVGHHDKFAPEGDTEFLSIHCRVDLGIPRRYEGGLAAAMTSLEAAAEQHGLVLTTSMMGDGLTFSTPQQTAGAILRGLPHFGSLPS